MASQSSTLMAAAILLTTFISGCLDDPTNPSAPSAFTLHQQEAATYVVVVNGEPTWSLAIEYELRDNLIYASWHAINSSSPASGTGVIDATTGQRLFYERGDTRVYFSGPGFSMPHDSFIALNANEEIDVGQIRLDDIALLFGPQWTLLRGNTQESVAGVTTRGRINDDGWSLSAKASCWASCPANLGAIPLTHEWTGGEGILPETVEYYSSPEFGTGLHLRRLSHELGEPADVVFAAPRPGAIARPVALCGDWPCEPGDWSQRLSPAFVQETIAADVDYQLWRSENPMADPMLLVASTGGAAFYGNTSIGEQAGGGINYASVGDKVDQFGALWLIVGDQPLSQASVRIHSSYDWLVGAEGPGQPEELVSLGDAMRRVTGATALDEAELSALGIYYFGNGTYPVPTQRYQGVFWFGPGGSDASVVAVSLADGSFIASSRVPGAPLDPNRV